MKEAREGKEGSRSNEGEEEERSKDMDEEAEDAWGNSVAALDNRRPPVNRIESNFCHWVMGN